jgi:hypothetical protein
MGVYSPVDMQRATTVLSGRVPQALAERVRSAAARRGAPVALIIEEALMQYVPELAPEEFVLDHLNGYESLTVRVRPESHGDVAEFVDAAPRREILGKRLGKPLPLSQLIEVVARPERAGRTVVELVALPGDFAGVRVYVATVPTGVAITLTVSIDDLRPSLRER